MKKAGQLGRNIRRRREELGWSRSEFARKVGVSPTAVQNWEELGVSPRSDIMLVIADVLEVDPVFLIDDGSADHEDAEKETLESPPSAREAVAKARQIIAEALDVPPAKVDILVRY